MPNLGEGPSLEIELIEILMGRDARLIRGISGAIEKDDAIVRDRQDRWRGRPVRWQRDGR